MKYKSYDSVYGDDQPMRIDHSLSKLHVIEESAKYLLIPT